MNKKLIITIAVVAVIVVAVVVGLIFIIGGQKKELNLQELYTTISEKTPFSEMPTMDIDDSVLTSLYEMEEGDYSEAVGKMPMMNIQASMFLIVKASEGKLDTVKEKVETYAARQEDSWSRYLPEQYELVKQRKLDVIGDYVYLIIAENASEIEEIIRK